MGDILSKIRSRKMPGESWQDRLHDGKLSGDDLQCPYCGYVIEDLTEYGFMIDGDGASGEVDCPSCDKIFTTDLYISYRWTSTRKKEA